MKFYKVYFECNILAPGRIHSTDSITLEQLLSFPFEGDEEEIGRDC